MNRYLVVVALFALGLSLIELSEVVELPFESWFVGGSSSSVFTTAALISLMKEFGYISLFGLMTLESASLPIPSEIVLPFAGYLVYIGVMNFELALAVSVIAGLVGALIDYYIALLLGRTVVYRFLRRFGVRESALRSAERWFGGKGAWAVLGARLVPLLRSIISFPAGLFKMRLSTFAVMTAVGCLGWSAVLIYAGYAAGQLWGQVLGSSSALLATGVTVIVAVASVVYLCYFVYEIRRNQNRRAGGQPFQMPTANPTSHAIGNAEMIPPM